MAESLFTTQTPSGQAFDATGITLGTTIKFAVAGTVTHIRFYAHDTLSGGTYVGGLYEVTTFDTGSLDPGSGAGTLLGSATFGALTAGVWNSVALGTAITIDTSKTYRVAVYTSVGRYKTFSNLFVSSALVNGNLTGPRHNQGGAQNVFNGAYNYATGITFPNDHFSGEAYGVDLTFQASGGTDLPYDGEGETPLLNDTPASFSQAAAYAADTRTPLVQDSPARSQLAIATAADQRAGYPVRITAQVAGSVAAVADGVGGRPVTGLARSALSVEMAADSVGMRPAVGLATYELAGPGAQDLSFDALGISPRLALPAPMQAKLDELFRAVPRPPLLADMPARSAVTVETQADSRVPLVSRSAAAQVVASQSPSALGRGGWPARGLAVATLGSGAALPVDVVAVFSTVVKADFTVPVVQGWVP